MLRNKFLAIASPFVLSAVLLTSTTNVMAMRGEDDREKVDSPSLKARLGKNKDGVGGSLAQIPSLSPADEKDPSLENLHAHLFSKGAVSVDLPNRVAIWQNAAVLFPKQWDFEERTSLVRYLLQTSPGKIEAIGHLLSIGVNQGNFSGRCPYPEASIFSRQIEEFVKVFSAGTEESITAIAKHAAILFPKEWDFQERTSLVRYLLQTSPGKIEAIGHLLSIGVDQGNFSGRCPYPEASIFSRQIEEFVKVLSAGTEESITAIAKHAAILFPKECVFAEGVELVKVLSPLTPEQLEQVVATFASNHSLPFSKRLETIRGIQSTSK